MPGLWPCSVMKEVVDTGGIVRSGTLVVFWTPPEQCHPQFQRPWLFCKRVVASWHGPYCFVRVLQDASSVRIVPKLWLFQECDQVLQDISSVRFVSTLWLIQKCDKVLQDAISVGLWYSHNDLVASVMKVLQDASCVICSEVDLFGSTAG